MAIKVIFGKVFRLVRTAKNVTQEHFSVVSSRTYVSSVERGVYSVSVDKLDELASVLKVHPVTILYMTYLYAEGKSISDETLIERVKEEVKSISESL